MAIWSIVSYVQHSMGSAVEGRNIFKCMSIDLGGISGFENLILLDITQG